MKYNICDIVKIKNLNLEGMIVSIGIDLETNQYKYQVHVQDQEYTYYCLEDQISFVTTLQDLVDEVVEQNTPVGNA